MGLILMRLAEMGLTLMGLADMGLTCGSNEYARAHIHGGSHTYGLHISCGAHMHGAESVREHEKERVC